MKNIIKFYLLFIFVSVSVHSISAPSGFDIIKKRVTEAMIQQGVDDNQVEILIASFRADSTWPGINYVDVSREGFQHSRHYSNMVSLARAYRLKESEFYKNRKVKSVLQSALAYWVKNDFICDNWWYNQIGTPNALVTVMLLIGDELPEELVQKTQPIIGRAHLTASGARPSGDRIKIAGILAKNLLFTGDKKQFDEVIRVIEGEIKFSTGQRGMQHDYSFHHREDRVNNTLSYGLGYADAFAEWAAYVAGTEYAFSDEKIGQLVDYYLDGICKQMVYGKYDDTGTKNRDITREESNSPMGTSTPEKLLKASKYRMSELQKIIALRRGEVSPDMAFSKFFWQTEHYVHQRPGYFTSVRMHSTRNRNMEEPYNSEGLKNHHRGDGTNHLSVTGHEYHNIAPVFDWQKIPGATILQKSEMPAPGEIQKDGLTSFVGAVTDGLYGAVAYDFKSPHDPVSVKKAWFFFDQEYVCMGSDIRTRSSLPVVTTINQCLLKGEVKIKSGNTAEIAEPGEYKIENVHWISHAGVSYLFPDKADVNLSNLSQTGSWFEVNKQSDSPKETISLDVFKLWMDHGPRVNSASYAYIVVPETGNKEPGTAADRGVEILINSPDIQAVKHKGLQIIQVVFYKAGEIRLNENTMLVCDHPGMIMVKMDGNRIRHISVADPDRKLGKFHFSVTGHFDALGENFKSFWNEKEKMTDFSVRLPESVYTGQSVTILL